MKATARLQLIITSCIGITLYSSENNFGTDKKPCPIQSHANQQWRNYDQEIALTTAQFYMAAGKQVPEDVIRQCHPETRSYDHQLYLTTAQSYMASGRQVPTDVIEKCHPKDADAATQYNRNLKIVSQLP